MNITLTETQQEAVILTILKRDLQNVQESLVCWNTLDHFEEYAERQSKQLKKNIKMLKRAINFYSVMDEY